MTSPPRSISTFHPRSATRRARDPSRGRPTPPRGAGAGAQTAPPQYQTPDRSGPHDGELLGRVRGGRAAGARRLGPEERSPGPPTDGGRPPSRRASRQRMVSRGAGGRSGCAQLAASLDRTLPRRRPHGDVARLVGPAGGRSTRASRAMRGSCRRPGVVPVASATRTSSNRRSRLRRPCRDPGPGTLVPSENGSPDGPYGPLARTASVAVRPASGRETALIDLNHVEDGAAWANPRAARPRAMRGSAGRGSDRRHRAVRSKERRWSPGRTERTPTATGTADSPAHRRTARSHRRPWICIDPGC